MDAAAVDLDFATAALEDATLTDAPRQPPSFVATLPGGDLCVTDVLTHQLHVLSLAGELKRTVDASPRLQFPMGIACDGECLYVADGHSDCILKIRLADGETVAHVGGLQYPHGVAYAGGRLFVCDCFNHRLVVYDSRLVELRAIGRRGVGHGEFMYPRGVAVHGDEVFVADTDNHRVEVFLTAGGMFQYVRTIGGLDGPEPTLLREPYGLAHAHGRLFVAEMAGRLQVPHAGTPHTDALAPARALARTRDLGKPRLGPRSVCPRAVAPAARRRVAVGARANAHAC